MTCDVYILTRIRYEHNQIKQETDSRNKWRETCTHDSLICHLEYTHQH